MGYLHAGHLSLVDQARRQCDLVVVSIFVNPAQFAAGEDLASYPRDFKRDFDLLAAKGVDYVFFPAATDMYPADYSTWINVEGVSEVLCGSSRPSHFRGVATVVLKLVNIAYPNYMYMGEKDFQQIAVLNRMLTDLNLETVIVSCPIIREADGLAMSSRNKYLDEQQRQEALCLYKCLQKAKEKYARGIRFASQIIPQLKEIIEQHNGSIDYLEFRDQSTLEKAEVLDYNSRLFLAVYIGKTRLIDNSLLV
jgi:pantoate--beta-alanine ligase